MSTGPDTPIDELDLPYGYAERHRDGGSFTIGDHPLDEGVSTEWIEIRPYGAAISLEDAR